MSESEAAFATRFSGRALTFFTCVGLSLIAWDTARGAPQDTAAVGSQSGPAGSLEEVIVSARKREESIVDVPDAVTAFSTAQIEDYGIRTLRDFTDLTPNMTVTTGSGAAYPNIMIRGLSQAQGGEAPIAVVVDGVQLSHPAFISQDYGDVAQVEVLRGPQGSLYGRNAIGGAINITTRQPTNDLEARVKVSYGNADTVIANAAVSGPIVEDKVLFRLGGTYSDTDGQIRNVFSGERADFGEREAVNGRLIFNLTDAWNLDLRGTYIKDDIGVLSAEIVTRDDWDDFDPGFLRDNPALEESRELSDVSAKLEYAGTYFNFTSVTGYSEVADLLSGDADFTPANIVLQRVRLDVESFTEEVRFSSPSEGRLRWLFGGFYQDRDTNNFLDIPIDDGTGNPVPGAFAIRSRDVGTSESWAVFGSASYDIVSELELTLGARYDEDERTSVDEEFPGSEASDTFSSFQPKVQLLYRAPNGMNLYATYGRGFSSGGFNAFFSGPAARLYEAQTAENYEIGVKGSLIEGLMAFSASVFRVYYEDQQFFFITTDPPSQNIANIDETRVDGAEVEVSARPVEGLEISAGLGLTDAEIRAFAEGPTSVGNRSPQNPDYTFNLSAQYRFALTPTLDLRTYASYRRQGSMYWDAPNTLRTEPKDFVNARLFLEADRWSVGIFGRNLANEQYPTIAAADAVGPDLNLRIPSSRRSYGVEAAYRF